MAGKPKTIDEYLAALSDDKRAALEKIRKTIRAAAPQAEECISYQIPAFRQNGMLVGFGATANHCAFYLMSSTTVAVFKEQLKGYDTGVARAGARRAGYVSAFVTLLSSVRIGPNGPIYAIEQRQDLIYLLRNYRRDRQYLYSNPLAELKLMRSPKSILSLKPNIEMSY